MIFEGLTMKLFTLVAVALLPFSLARAAAEEPAFRELKAVAVSGAEFSARVHYDPPGTTLVNKPYKRDEGEHYLIKTPFGLLGWIRYSASAQQADLIEGLYFKGD